MTPEMSQISAFYEKKHSLLNRFLLLFRWEKARTRLIAASTSAQPLICMSGGSFHGMLFTLPATQLHKQAVYLRSVVLVY